MVKEPHPFHQIFIADIRQAPQEQIEVTFLLRKTIPTLIFVACQLQRYSSKTALLSLSLVKWHTPAKALLLAPSCMSFHQPEGYRIYDSPEHFPVLRDPFVLGLWQA